MELRGTLAGNIARGCYQIEKAPTAQEIAVGALSSRNWAGGLGTGRDELIVGSNA